MKLRLLVVLSLIGAVAGCAVEVDGSPIAGRAPKPSTSPPPIQDDASCGLQIAFFGDLTGANSALVTPMRDAAKLAVDHYNEEHPECSVELLELDSQGKEEQAVALAQQAADDESVIGVVGGVFSGESKAAGPVYEQAGLAMVSPSATNPGLSGVSPTFHRVAIHDNSVSAATGRYVTGELKAREVFIVDDGTAYGATFAQGVTRAVGNVAGTTQIQPGGSVSDAVSEIKSANLDAVVFGGYYTDAAELFKQLWAAGVRAKFVGGDGMLDDKFAELAGKAAEGVTVTCSCVPAEEAGDGFAEAYQSEFGDEPGIFAAEAFDATSVFLDAVVAGQRNRAAVLSFVEDYAADGITRRIRFDRNGDLVPSSRTVWTYVVRDGQFEPGREIRP